MAWCLGANDAANPTDCAVGGGAIDLKRALILFALFTAAGALLQGFMVMKTIDRGIVSKISILGALTTTLAACIWITLCTWKGMPISTTHSIVSAVIGYGLIAHGIEGIKWSKVRDIFIGFAASPILSLLLAMGLYLLFEAFFRRIGEARSIERLMRYTLVGALCFSAYSFGANDVGNATGVFLSITEEEIGASAKFLLAAFGSIGIALGGFTWGYRVIETAARRITRLSPLTGLSAEMSNALTVFLFTTIPYILFEYGLPISTTHSSIGSIIGVGLLKGLGGIDRTTVAKIVASWALTIPAVALMNIALYKTASVLIAI